MFRKTFRVFFQVFFFSGAVILAFKASHLKNSHHLGDVGRIPAAIPKVDAFAELDGVKFEEASRRRLFAGLSTTNKGRKLRLQLGHFLTKSDNGDTIPACHNFDRVLFVFSAEGIALSGARPVIEIEGACQGGFDSVRTVPLWVSLDRVKSLRPETGTGDLVFEDQAKTIVRFQNIPEAWPSQWVLKEARMFSTKTAARISLSGSEIYRMAGAPPPIVEW